jgi:hypothetical protein
LHPIHGNRTYVRLQRFYAAWLHGHPLTSRGARRPYAWAGAFCDFDREGMDS